MPISPTSNESFQAFLDLSMTYWPRLAAAIFGGGIIGLENQIYGKSAGLRTCLMVAISCCVITIISIETAIVYGGEPARISAQIVTGIGFIGAGVILVRGGKIAGITTASTIFFTAGLGITAGTGYIFTTVAISIIAVAVLILLKPIDRFIDKHPFVVALRVRDQTHRRLHHRKTEIAKAAKVITPQEEGSHGE